MSEGVRVEWIGLDRLKVMLERIENGMDPHVQKALDGVADKVKEDAQAICPVGTPASTGNPRYITSHALQRSIRKEAVARPAGTKWEIGVRAGGYIINPNSGKFVDYAIPVEYGWSQQAPKGFLRPALYKNLYALQAAGSKMWDSLVKEAFK